MNVRVTYPTTGHTYTSAMDTRPNMVAEYSAFGVIAFASWPTFETLALMADGSTWRVANGGKLVPNTATWQHI